MTYVQNHIYTLYLRDSHALCNPPQAVVHCHWTKAPKGRRLKRLGYRPNSNLCLACIRRTLCSQIESESIHLFFVSIYTDIQWQMITAGVHSTADMYMKTKRLRTSILNCFDVDCNWFRTLSKKQFLVLKNIARDVGVHLGSLLRWSTAAVVILPKLGCQMVYWHN
jgi:predicted lysophospholipase L1 biosynthesis ABC-type transport system permease subunit